MRLERGDQIQATALSQNFFGLDVKPRRQSVSAAAAFAAGAGQVALRVDLDFPGSAVILVQRNQLDCVLHRDGPIAFEDEVGVLCPR